MALGIKRTDGRISPLPVPFMLSIGGLEQMGKARDHEAKG